MILDKIVKKRKLRVTELKQIKSFDQIKNDAGALPVNKNFIFEQSLRNDDIAFICEIKKASPSKGLISKNFQYLKIAKEYELAKAAAVSVITEPDFFLGNNKYLTEISNSVKIPVLRKDFIIDEYQIYESKIIGASAILLICAILDAETISRYIKIAHTLGLSVLVEVHNETEAAIAVKAGARIIGVNNRDLRTFKVDINNTVLLRRLIPDNIIFVSESGIKTPEDIDILRRIKANAVLIGETLMRSEDKLKQLLMLRGDI